MLLGLSGGIVYCWVFQVAMSLSWVFKWQCVVLGLIGGNVCS